MEGFDASEAYERALMAQEEAKRKEEAYRTARKAALYASLAHGRQRAKKVLSSVLQVVRCH